jgi:hypothetical protein
MGSVISVPQFDAFHKFKINSLIQTGEIKRRLIGQKGNTFYN